MEAKRGQKRVPGQKPKVSPAKPKSKSLVHPVSLSGMELKAQI